MTYDVLATIIFITGMGLPLWLGLGKLIRRWEQQAKDRDQDQERVSMGSPAESMEEEDQCT